MGLDALNSNGITTKIRYLIRDRTTLTSKEPLRRVRWSRILLFVVIQLAGFGTTMAITQTIGTFDLLVYLLPSRLIAEREVASRNRISNHHLVTHTFPYHNHPETPVYRRGIGNP
jgi:hypothetical protein